MLHFAVTFKKQNHDEKLFLMGEAVGCEGLVHEKYNVYEQMKRFIGAGGELSACVNCLKSRQKDGLDTFPISTMIDCVKIVELADKIITF